MIKEVTVLINVGAAAMVGVKRNQEREQGDGKVERHSKAINICHHQNLASLTLQPLWWRRWRIGSMVTGEGAAPMLVMET